MTRYSVDPAQHELIATWGTGEGDLTTRIATLPADTDAAALLRLARALTQLSEAAWHTYTHPASAADSLEKRSANPTRGLGLARVFAGSRFG